MSNDRKIGWFKRTKLYFFVMNAYWNYMFFMNARAVYSDKRFLKQSESLDMDRNLDMLNDKIRFDKTHVVKRRFVGYQFKGSIYLDNPGAQAFISREIVNIWKERGWI